MTEELRGLRLRLLLRHGRGCGGLVRAVQRTAKLLCACAALAAVEVELRAPLSTLVPGWSAQGTRVIVADVDVPPDAPADLGVGAYVRDRHGRWFQRALGPLRPGRHRLAVDVGAGDPLVASDEHRRWDASEAALCDRGGLFFWSATGSRARLAVTYTRADAAPAPAPAPARLGDLRHDRLTVAAGTRWELRFRPSPWPANPYAPDLFRADLVVYDPAGREWRLPAFADQPLRAQDRGDREIVAADGAAAFTVRYRPRLPGTHRLALEAQWADGRRLRCALPALTVTGAPRDEVVRVDAVDPRFFSVDGRLVWPIGPNLRSVWDVRSQERLGTTLTVDRGSLSYRAYLERFAAAGCDAVEIWLSSWNLALEWNAQWDGFHGRGRYAEGNAWRLDRILAECERLGIRVNLVINNHGQASERTDREWDLNPWSTANGGPLASAADVFTHERALAGQERLRRYLVGRYADSPAILGWKLWSEMNLTAGRREDLRTWHEQATARWKALDAYGHPVTSHWSGDWRTADPAICALPDLGFICIDAYHAPAYDRGIALADLLVAGLHTPARGLARFQKPVLITEYGGNWDAAPPPQLEAEHALGGWAALVSGYAGAPMLWWFEWVDQGARFAPYGALRRFLAGEDLRGAAAASVELGCDRPGLWARCWSRPGRRLGYVLDAGWGADGDGTREWRGVVVDHGAAVPAGEIAIEWWDADRGEIVERKTWRHPGGALLVPTPAFRRHIAFKLWRPTAADTAGDGGRATGTGEGSAAAATPAADRAPVDAPAR